MLARYTYTSPFEWFRRPWIEVMLWIKDVVDMMKEETDEGDREDITTFQHVPTQELESESTIDTVSNEDEGKRGGIEDFGFYSDGR
jgi:hypothetical protein